MVNGSKIYRDVLWRPDDEDVREVNRCIFVYIVLKTVILCIGLRWYDQILTKKFHSQKHVFTFI